MKTTQENIDINIDEAYLCAKKVKLMVNNNVHKSWKDDVEYAVINHPLLAFCGYEYKYFYQSSNRNGVVAYYKKDNTIDCKYILDRCLSIIRLVDDLGFDVEYYIKNELHVTDLKRMKRYYEEILPVYNKYTQNDFVSDDVMKTDKEGGLYDMANKYEESLGCE